MEISDELTAGFADSKALHAKQSVLFSAFYFFANTFGYTCNLLLTVITHFLLTYLK